MKKILRILIFLLLVTTLFSCSLNNQENKEFKNTELSFIIPSDYKVEDRPLTSYYQKNHMITIFKYGCEDWREGIVIEFIKGEVKNSFDAYINEIVHNLREYNNFKKELFSFGKYEYIKISYDSSNEFFGTPIPRERVKIYCYKGKDIFMLSYHFYDEVIETILKTLDIK